MSAPGQGLETPTEAASASTSTPAPPNAEPRIKALILDAGPLLSQAPLRGLANKYYIPPQVLTELKDKRARDHLEFLRMSGQVDLAVREAGPEAMTKVIAFAKKTGDYAVLSHPDLCVLALSYALEVEEHGTWRIREEPGGKTGQQRFEAERLAKAAQAPKIDESAQELAAAGSAAHVANLAETTDPPATHLGVNGDDIDAASNSSFDASFQDAPEEVHVEQELPSSTENTLGGGAEQDDLSLSNSVAATHLAADSERASETLEEDLDGVAPGVDDEDDGEGAWITPDNVVQHKNRSLGLVSEESEPSALSGKGRKGKKGKGQGKMTVACMTGDYAVQNVLLQMGLSLVSMEGQRISKVKSWVLRCHACFKICKDSERKFCPSCGNPTLLRTSVTSSAPNAKGETGLQVHLKKNFQYRNRGTIYSLPLPKPGRASGGKDSSVAAPILREDQAEWQRGVAREKVRQHKEERALQRALEKGKDSLTTRYEDPDWMPEMLLSGGKGRMAPGGGLPQIGSGRKNPNERRRSKK